MIKKLLLSIFTLSLVQLSAQNFSAMYHFSGVLTSTNTGSVDPTPTPTANGIVFGSFMSSAGLPSTVAASGAFAFNTWTTGATNNDDVNFTGGLDPTQYMAVTITPVANSTITITDIKFNMSRSGTGPRHWSVRGSVDSYSTNLTATIALTNSNITTQSGDRFFWSLDSYTFTSGKQEAGCKVIPGGPYSALTSSVAFRFYAWDAEANTGTFRIDTVIFNGSASVFVGLNKVTTELNSGFKMYPNPSADGIITIEAKANFSKVEVINILGSVVASSGVKEEEKIRLDLNTLPEGTYFVRITNGNNTHTEKLILNR